MWTIRSGNEKLLSIVLLIEGQKSCLWWLSSVAAWDGFCVLLSNQNIYWKGETNSILLLLQRLNCSLAARKVGTTDFNEPGKNVAAVDWC